MIKKERIEESGGLSSFIPLLLTTKAHGPYTLMCVRSSLVARLSWTSRNEATVATTSKFPLSYALGKNAQVCKGK